MKKNAKKKKNLEFKKNVDILPQNKRVYGMV